MSLPNQSAARRCDECGAPLCPGAKGGLCLRCALGNALTPPDSEPLIPLAGANSENQPITGGDLLVRTFGDYELLEELGRGGMGVVYKARQKSLGRTVAVKMILAGQYANKEFVTRFRAEAAAAAVLQHPNIIAIHEVGVQDGQHYFSMDYVPGRTLGEIVRQGPLPARKAASYLKTVAEAICYAHEQGILHRDLKPANVLIDGLDQPHITDFGLAKRLTPDSSGAPAHYSLTLSGQVVGSPNYMAPEQATGRHHRITRRTDVYSLGAMLYHLLTGRPPFVGETIAETLRQVETVDPVLPRLLNPGVPRDLETICLKCLEKDPVRRYPTTQTLADELGRFLDRKPILSRPIGPVGKAWRWCRRKPVIATLSATTVLLLLVVAIGSPFALFHVNKHRHRAEQNAGDLRLSLYAAQMNQAFRARDVGNLNVAQALFDAQRPEPGETDLRGTDWRWLWALCRSEAKAVLPTQGEWLTFAAEPSPDGQWVAMAGSSTNIAVHNLDLPSQPQILRGHTRPFLNFAPLAFSPDGQRLASASGGFFQERGSCELFLWELATWKKTILEGHTVWLLAVAFSLDGKLLASASLDGTVGLWDVGTRTAITMLRGHRGPVFGVAFSQDSKSLFTAGEDGTVRHWDVGTCQEISQPFQHELPVWFVAVAPDARTIATACTDNHLRLWDTTSRQLRQLRYSPGERVMAPAFSPDGRLLAFGTGNNIRIWDFAAERERTVLRGSAGIIRSLRFTRDGRELFSASEFDRPMVWTLDRPEKLTTLRGFREGIRSMMVSPDQKLLLVGSGDFIEPERSAEVLVFDLASQKPALPPLNHPAAVNSLSMSADGNLLATGCQDRSVRVFGMPEGRLLRTLTNAANNKTDSLLFSPDGRTLVTCGGSPEQVAVWDTATWQSKSLLSELPGGPQGCAFSPDGTLLVTPMVGAWAIVWDMPSGTTNQPLKLDKPARGAAFSWDGTMLALFTYFDIHLFEVKGWRPVETLRGHQHVLNQVTFAPDGKTLASVGIEGALRLWSVPARAEVAALYDHLDSAQTVAFTADGQWLLSGSRDKTVKLRRIPSFAEIRAAERATATPR